MFFASDWWQDENVKDIVKIYVQYSELLFLHIYEFGQFLKQHFINWEQTLNW